MRRRLAEEGEIKPDQVQQSDALFRLLVESVRDYAIFLLDPQGYILSWNEGAKRLKGYEPAEIIGQHFSIFYPAEEVQRGKPERALATAAAEGRWEDEGWRVRNDGSRFWANVLITALRDKDGRLIGFAKVTRDLTERRRAEDERARLLALERSARQETEATVEQLRAIQSVTEAALAHLNVDELLQALLLRVTEVLSADTAAILLLDESTQELVARAARGLEEEVEQGVRIPVGRGFAGRIAAQRRPIVLDNVADADVLNPILRSRGIESLLGVPLIVGGKVIGVLHVGSQRPRRFSETEVNFLQIVGDRVALAIDHARAVEAALDARREAEIAEATVRARDQFLSLAAHELKTPLTSLQIAAELLARGLDSGRAMDPSRTRQALGRIQRQTARLSGLVTQLLETVRLQEGRLELRRAPTDLGELVASLAGEAQSRTDRHEVRVMVPEPIEACVDALRLEQVVTNLLDNAIKFSPDGGPIDVELTRPLPDTVRLVVRDRGLGVPPEHRSRLFERFYQAHSGDHRSGLGLGLFVSRQIVEMHGGSIAASFPPDGGTALTVELPIAKAD